MSESNNNTKTPGDEVAKKFASLNDDQQPQRVRSIEEKMEAAHQVNPYFSPTPGSDPLSSGRMKI